MLVEEYNIIPTLANLMIGCYLDSVEVHRETPAPLLTDFDGLVRGLCTVRRKLKGQSHEMQHYFD